MSTVDHRSPKRIKSIPTTITNERPPIPVEAEDSLLLHLPFPDPSSTVLPLILDPGQAY
jgi:hypothetical protein